MRLFQAAKGSEQVVLVEKASYRLYFANLPVAQGSGLQGKIKCTGPPLLPSNACCIQDVAIHALVIPCAGGKMVSTVQLL